MTETFGSYVHEAHGSVHSGDGPQFNFYYAAEARLREQASRRPRAVAKEDRELLAARFVPPRGMQLARDRLAERNTVLIDGLPGSGRRTAAIMLLHELSDARGSLHELPDTSDDTSGDTAASPLDIRDIGAGDRLLLDLSESEESRYIAIQNTLSDFRDSLVRRGAHLTVVLPHHLGYLLRGELKRLTVEIGRPTAQRVLVRHLRQEGIDPASSDLGGSGLLSYLAQAPMRDVAGLADRIRHCRDISPADRGFSDWLAESLVDQHDQSARVAADLATWQDGRHRALLLSLALFHGAASGTVLQGANALLRVLSHPPDPTPRLDRADLHAELSGIGAETLADGRVRFRIAGYDRAVRDHFWTFLPDIRRQFRDWFDECLTDPSLLRFGRKEVVARFAAQSLRTARPEDLSWLAQRWTSNKAPARLDLDAAQLLACGLDDEHYGRFFRQQIYDWSTSMETSYGLRRVLVPVCSTTMAGAHPDQALVRLHHLARRTNGLVGADARRALLALAGSDHRLYRRMLDRLGAGIAQGQWDEDRALFLELADPVRLVGYRSVRASLITCWHGVLRHPVASWTEPLARWLTASEDVRHRDLALRVLSAACEADVRVSGCLYRAARQWLHADPSASRAETVSVLLRKIDTAQGIESYPLAV
ncbi:ABC transporter substrate-binding protein [Streptomyces sp. NPDC051576]|uniref:ABC transporter substrate-binding protein n=1 Tax=Streptomyces sp. NPDC051576 TaxID=3155803 RepID=UPI003435098F